MKGAMGDDQLCFRTKFGAHRNIENYPPAHSVRFRLRVQKMSPFKGGILSVSDPEGRGIKPFMIKKKLAVDSCQLPSTNSLLIL